jgi:hypothetical protein
VVGVFSLFCPFAFGVLLVLVRARELESNESNESRMNESSNLLSNTIETKRRRQQKDFFLDRENKIPTKIPISTTTKNQYY